MTSIRDLLGESLAVGETVRVTLEESDDGTLVADHPRDGSPMDIAVVYGLDRLEGLEERPPDGPIAVEIVGEVVDGRIAGRVVGLE